MIRVPTYGQPQVGQAPLADNRLRIQSTPDSFGAAVGEGVQAVGREAGAAALDYQHEQDRLAKEAKAKADAVAVADLRNQSDAQVIAQRDQIAQTKGKDAIKLPDQVFPAYDKQTDKTMAEIKDPDQQTHYRLYRDAQRNDLTSFLNNHVAGQMQAYDQQDFEAGTHLVSDQVGQVYQSHDLVNNALHARNEQIASFAERHGLPASWAEARSVQETDANLMQVITRHVADGDYKAAGSWFNEYGHQLTPQSRLRAQELVKTATVDGEAKRIALDVTSATVGDVEHPNIEAATAAVDKSVVGMPANIRDDVVIEAKRRTVQMLNQQAAARTETMNGTEYQILSLANDPKTPLGFDDKQVQDLWRTLDPLRQAKMKAALTKLDEPSPDDSIVALNNVQRGLADPATRDGLIANGPELASRGMTKSDAQKAREAWSTAKLAQQGDPKAKHALEGLQSKNEAIDSVLTAAGVDLAKSGNQYTATGSSSVPATATLLDYIDREGKAMQEARKDRAPLTTDDWKVVAGKALATQTIKGTGWFGGDQSMATAGIYADLLKNGGDVPGGGRIPPLPPAQQATMEAEFNAAHGRFPTYPEMLQLWGDHLQRHPQAAPAPASDQHSGATGFLTDLWNLYG